MFYILRHTFTPNTASSNRALAYYRAMDSLGIEGTIVVLQPDSNNSRIEENYKHLQIVHCWNSLSASNKLFKRIYFYISVIRFIKRLKSGDKIYIYGSLPCIHRLVNRRDIDVFVEVTEHPKVYPIETRFRGNSLQSMLEDCKKLRGLFVISTKLKEYYVSQGINADRVHIINMIVDPERFVGLTKNTTKRYVCYCGNGNNKKDKVDELIKLFKKIVDKHPEVLLYIVGPKQQFFKDEQDNVELVRTLGLNDKVVFTGILSAEKIPQILVNAEVLVLNRPNTLQNESGFSTKLGEYLLSGTPVVATTVGDIPLFLKDGVNALLADPGDFFAVEQKIDWALSNPQLASVIGDSGRNVALSSFNATTETRKLMACVLDK